LEELKKNTVAAAVAERPVSAVSGKDGTAAEAKAVLYRAVAELKTNEAAEIAISTSSAST
jgi:hypothetical protein